MLLCNGGLSFCRMLNGQMEINIQLFVDQFSYLLPKLIIGETGVSEFIFRSLNVKKDNAGHLQSREWSKQTLFCPY